MNLYHFTNSGIDLACREIDSFLASSGVEHREALRIKLSCEEVLLKYQRHLGENAGFKVKLVKLLSSIRVDIIVAGESCNVLQKDAEEDEIIHGLLARIGLAPTWSYKNRRNHILFAAKKKPMSGTTKMAVAFVLAVIVGILLNLLPEGIRNSVNE